MQSKLLNISVALLASSLLTSPSIVSALTMEACLAIAAAEASDTTTVGELRRNCELQIHALETMKAEAAEKPTPYTPVERRYLRELSIRDNRFAITAHRPNYLLVAAHDTSGVNPAGLSGTVGEDTESKFQVSMKFPLIENLFGDGRGDIYAAYTNRSFWQVYDKAGSSPFRETNHEPEAWFSWKTDWHFAGFHNRAVRVGLNHQSNGRGGNSISRSWNRIFTEFIFERSNYAGSLKTWWRIPEDDADDDNPDIDDYMGFFEFTAVYTRKKHSFSLMFRNNLRSENHGAAQLEWNFPLIKHFDGYIQYFNGYGESLIDYNANVNSIGIGVSLTDWL